MVSTMDQASYSDVIQVLQEKDRKLTDAKLEALTTQHQLHQLQDQIAQMQVISVNTTLQLLCKLTLMFLKNMKVCQS